MTEAIKHFNLFVDLSVLVPSIFDIMLNLLNFDEFIRLRVPITICYKKPSESFTGYRCNIIKYMYINCIKPKVIFVVVFDVLSYVPLFS